MSYLLSSVAFVHKSTKHALIAISVIFVISLSNLVLAAEKKADQYDELGIKFQDAINSQDLQSLEGLLDIRELAIRSARTPYDKEDDIQGFVRRYTKFGEKALLEKVFSTVFQQDGYADYLRVIDGNKPLVRITFPEGGYEYMVFSTQVKNEQLSVVDIFMLSSGRELSVTLGAVTQLLISPSESLIKRMFGVQEFNADLASNLQEIVDLKTAGKYEGAYKAVQRLPEDIRNHRVLMDLAIQLSAVFDENEYVRQLSLLEKHHGNDPATTFILIDHYFYEKNYVKAGESVDKLIERFGEDAALLNLKSTIAYLAGQFDTARGYAKAAIEMEPYFEDAYSTLASIYTDEKSYARLVELLRTIEANFEFSYSKDDFVSDEFYAEFVQSKEFKDWLN